MPELLLGPLLRHVDETRATVWVETDAPCEVAVLGARADVHRAGHHCALVMAGLPAGAVRPYGVALDGQRVWPPEGEPDSLIRTLAPGAERIRIAFGSCRVAAPQHPPYTWDPADDRSGRGPDALHALALRLRRTPPAQWPDVLLLVGDQVYADDVPPGTREWIRRRRDTSRPPGEEVADFEEFAKLYRESWSQPTIRWLLSTVPTAMIFDDHDVRDDWNISAAWRREMAARPWWPERIIGGLTAYWLYQHLGNLDPDTRARDETYAAVQAAGDGAAVLPARPPGRRRGGRRGGRRGPGRALELPVGPGNGTARRRRLAGGAAGRARRPARDGPPPGVALGGGADGAPWRGPSPAAGHLGAIPAHPGRA